MRAFVLLLALSCADFDLFSVREENGAAVRVLLSQKRFPFSCVKPLQVGGREIAASRRSAKALVPVHLRSLLRLGGLQF